MRCTAPCGDEECANLSRAGYRAQREKHRTDEARGLACFTSQHELYQEDGAAASQSTLCIASGTRQRSKRQARVSSWNQPVFLEWMPFLAIDNVRNDARG
uniref:Uncharacterized protein n=1 Tax=Chrysotila carterae TaxID=13221 RepID=A0A7S4FAQ9_CHRCT